MRLFKSLRNFFFGPPSIEDEIKEELKKKPIYDPKLTKRLLNEKYYSRPFKPNYETPREPLRSTSDNNLTNMFLMGAILHQNQEAESKIDSTVNHDAAPSSYESNSWEGGSSSASSYDSSSSSYDSGSSSSDCSSSCDSGGSCGCD